MTVESPKSPAPSSRGSLDTIGLSSLKARVIELLGQDHTVDYGPNKVVITAVRSSREEVKRLLQEGGVDLDHHIQVVGG